MEPNQPNQPNQPGQPNQPPVPQQPQQPWQPPQASPQGWGYGAPANAPWTTLPPDGPTWVPGIDASGRKPGRLRWVVALGLVLIVAVVSVAGAFLLSGAAGANTSLTAAYAPKGTSVFLDVRADLPGDQHQNLADFMSHFPGFMDRAQFDSGFDDILNRITASISPDLTYTYALRSWTTGEVSLAATHAAAVNSLLGSQPSDVGVLIVAIKDRAAGESWVASEVARGGATFSQQGYAGTTLFVSSQAQPMAYAFTDRVFVAGDEISVKAALDAPAKGSLADDKNYGTAIKSLPGDCVATFYMDPAALMKSALGSAGMMSEMGSLAEGDLPAWLVGSVRAESDRIDVEIKMPKINGLVSSGNKPSDLAGHLPGSTVGVFELHAIGSSLNSYINLVGMAATSDADRQSFQQLQTALQAIGGLTWIGDGALVLTDAAGQLSGGFVIKTSDASDGDGRRAMVSTLVALGGGSLGLTESYDTYKGHTVTMVDVPSSITGADPIKISVAATDDIVFIGYGEDFARAMIDTTAATSLAAQPDFKSAMSAVGESNSSYAYWNLPATASQIFQTSMSQQYYDLNYKPYVEHVGGSAMAVIDGETVTLRLVVTAK